MTRDDEIATAVHGGLTATHLTAALWHLMDDERDRENVVYGLIHASAAGFSLISVLQHLSDHESS